VALPSGATPRRHRSSCRRARRSRSHRMKDGDMNSYDLITGGAGFIGCNLADALLAEGRRGIVADTMARSGSERNAEWLRGRHGDRVSILRADVRDAEAIGPLVRGADAVYHLAAQVAVT